MVLLTRLFEGYHDDAHLCGCVFSRDPDCSDSLRPYSAVEPGIFECDRRNFSAAEQLQSADLLLAISQASRDDAIDKLDLNGEQVVNIGAAVERGFCPEEGHPARARAVHFRLGISRAFVLYVPGGFDSRKNFERLFAAFGNLPGSVRAAHQLVITGRLDYGRIKILRDSAAEHGLSQEELLLAGYVSDDELLALYRSAALFVFRR